MPLLLPQRPAWVLPGAIYDLDFANNRYWGGGVYLGQSGGNGSRGSLLIGGPVSATANTIFRPDSNGILRTFPLTSPCITPGLGLWAEEVTTNYALQCRDFTQPVWVSGGGGVSTTKTGVVGADNSTGSATRITASGANATILQSITQASKVEVSSVYVKRRTGTGVIEMTQDGGGVWTNITSQINSNGFVMAQVPSATITNPVVGFRIQTSGDAIDADFWQTESSANGYPTSRLLTTTATRTRAADSPSFGTDASAFNAGLTIPLDTYYNTPMTCLSIASGNGVSGCRLKGGGTFGKTILSGGCSGGPVSFGHGINPAITSNNGTSALGLAAAGLGPWNKAMGRMTGAGCYAILNGGPIAFNTDSIAPPTVDNTPHMGCGNNAAAQFSLNGYTAREVLWNKELTDGELIYYTTPGTVGGL